MSQSLEQQILSRSDYHRGLLIFIESNPGCTEDDMFNSPVANALIPIGIRELAIELWVDKLIADGYIYEKSGRLYSSDSASWQDHNIVTENKMKITKRQLKQIIREEYTRLVKQGLVMEASPMGGSGKINPDTIDIINTFLRVNPYWHGGGDEYIIKPMAMSISGMDGLGNEIPYFSKFDSLEEVEEELHYFGELATAIKHVHNEDLHARTGDGMQTKLSFEDIMSEFELSAQELEELGMHFKRKFKKGDPRRHRTMGPVFG